MKDYRHLSGMEFIQKYGNRTYKSYELDNKLIEQLALHWTNFSVQCYNLDELQNETQWLEKTIEQLGFRCRVYTENRSVAMGAAIFSDIGMAIGLGSALAIAAHNLATFDPDYEIGKNLLDKKINVVFKKEGQSVNWDHPMKRPAMAFSEYHASSPYNEHYYKKTQPRKHLIELENLLADAKVKELEEDHQ